MSLNNRKHLVIALTLALVMIATRVNHFGNIPDASWAAFFLGGFYLSRMFRWVFPALMGLAVVIDYAVIRNSGVSFWDHYCVSAAYWFLLPAYLTLWFGGAWLQRHINGLNMRSVGVALAAAMIAISACFVIANGSFYWLSDAISARSLLGWGKNLSDWYLPYLHGSSLYLALATMVHLMVVQIRSRVQTSVDLASNAD